MLPDDPEITGEGLAPDNSEVGILADESAATEALTAIGATALAPSEVKEYQTRWEYRCKICQLAVKHPTMYKMLHDLVIKDGMSYNSAMAEMNAYVKQHRIQVATFNMVNVLGHFKKHVDIDAKTARAVAQATAGAPLIPSAVRPLASYIDQLTEQKARSEIDDYENLDSIRLKVTAVMNKLLDELEEVDSQDNKLKLGKHGVQLFVTLVSETRACINDLNKMRQSEKLMNTVVQQLLEKMTFSIIPQLLEEYKSLNEELEHQGVSAEIREMIDIRMRTKTAQIIATTARAAVTDIQRQFKLR